MSHRNTSEGTGLLWTTVYDETFLTVISTWQLVSGHLKSQDMRNQVFRPTGLRKRAEFVWLWVEGWSAKAIAQHTSTSVTTVYRWIRRWQREGNVHDRPRSGRPRSAAKKAGNFDDIHLTGNTEVPNVKKQSHSFCEMFSSVGCNTTTLIPLLTQNNNCNVLAGQITSTTPRPFSMGYHILN